jgi:hypothetical protein
MLNDISQAAQLAYEVLRVSACTPIHLRWGTRE